MRSRVPLRSPPRQHTQIANDCVDSRAKSARLQGAATKAVNASRKLREKLNGKPKTQQ